MTIRRPRSLRLVAALLATLLGLSGPGAALSHGLAHAREHRSADHRGREDDHAPHVLDRIAALLHGHEHREAPAADADAPGSASVAGAGAAVRQPMHASHGHPRLDAQAATRHATAALLPALPALVPVVPAIVATVPAPPATRALRLADPPTGPPPPSRAPPLG